MWCRPFKTIEIGTDDGFAVRGDLYLPAASPLHGIVLLCHGFKGHKSWGFLPFLALRLAAEGMAAYSIDFSLNGTFSPSLRGAASAAGSPGRSTPSARYPRPDLFRKNTIKREYEDLSLVLRYVDRHGLGGYIARSEPIGLFGHSRGGISAILNALENERIRALSTWSTPTHPDHFTTKQKARWRRNGEYGFIDAADNARLCLSADYLDDLERHHDRYDLRRRVENLRVPHLIVHGELDIAVGVDCARSLHEAERHLGDKKLLIVRTGHTFGVAGSPAETFDTPPRPLLEACDATVDWFGEHLEKGN